MSRAIDRQIAELMGYELFKDAPTYYVNHDKGDRLDFVPHFTESWNAMRLLVEWLQGKGLAIRLVIRTDGMAQATVYKQELHECEVEETLPLALCNVVLSLPSVVIQNA